MSNTDNNAAFLRFRFYLGHKTNRGGTTNLARANELVSNVYPSGFAVFGGSGRWLDAETGNVVSEGTTVFEVLVPNETGLELLQAQDLATVLAKECLQDAVLLSAEPVPVVLFVRANATV